MKKTKLKNQTENKMISVSLDIEAARATATLLRSAVQFFDNNWKGVRALPIDLRPPESALRLVDLTMSRVGMVGAEIEDAVYKADEKEYENFVPMGGFSDRLFKKTMKGLRKGGKNAR